MWFNTAGGDANGSGLKEGGQSRNQSVLASSPAQIVVVVATTAVNLVSPR